MQKIERSVVFNNAIHGAGSSVVIPIVPPGTPGVYLVRGQSQAGTWASPVQPMAVTVTLNGLVSAPGAGFDDEPSTPDPIVMIGMWELPVSDGRAEVSYLFFDFEGVGVSAAVLLVEETGSETASVDLTFYSAKIAE